MTEPLGEALLGLWRRLWPSIRNALHAAIEHVADAARPDPPLYMQTLEGDVVTGVVILDRGQAVAFFGTRHPRDRRRPSSAFSQQYYPNGYDDEPLWDRYGRPYGR